MKIALFLLATIFTLNSYANEDVGVGSEILCSGYMFKIKSLRRNGRADTIYNGTTHTNHDISSCENASIISSSEITGPHQVGDDVLCGGYMFKVKAFRRNGKADTVYNGTTHTNHDISSCENVTLLTPSEITGDYQVDDEILCGGYMFKIKALRRNGRADTIYNGTTHTNHDIRKCEDASIVTSSEISGAHQVGDDVLCGGYMFKVKAFRRNGLADTVYNGTTHTNHDIKTCENVSLLTPSEVTGENQVGDEILCSGYMFRIKALRRSGRADTIYNGTTHTNHDISKCENVTVITDNSDRNNISEPDSASGKSTKSRSSASQR